jgi:hypothetical protein
MLDHKRSLRFSANLGSLTFGIAWWHRIESSSLLLLSLLKMNLRLGSGRISGEVIAWSKNNVRLYITLCATRVTLSKVMESNPPILTFRRDLIGPRLIAWNELLHRLAVVQLSHGSDEFHWTLTENGNSLWVPCIMRWSGLYNRYLILRIYGEWRYHWRWRLPHGTFVVGWSLLKITLHSAIVREVRSVFYVIKMRQLNMYSSNATLLRLCGQSSK